MAADPAQPIAPRPLLADLVRTRDCAPGPVLLVEALDAAVEVSNRYRAVRLLLGDGVLCVQALLAAELHALVDGGVVYEGCYVRLEGFALRFFAAEGGGDTTAGNGEPLAYLRVDRLAVVGWNEAYMDMLRREDNEAAMAGTDGEVRNGAGERAEEARGKDIHQGTEVFVSEKRSPTPHAELDLDDDFPLDSDVEDALEAMDTSPSRAAQRRQVVSRPSITSSLPWASDDPTRPLRLTPLGSVPNLPYKQNWTVNVLCVVASLSAVEPSYLLSSPQQRAARLADPSTGKRLLLTVFLEPETFSPRVGSVVLLLGLKNHRFDGGCLKKYASDRPRGDKRWWFEEPDELGWCDVRGLKEWWTKHGTG